MYSDTRQWKRIRRRVLKLGESQRQVALIEGVGRRTVRKMLMSEFPPGYKGCNLHTPSAQEEELVHTSKACFSKSSRSKQRWMEWIYAHEQRPFEQHNVIGLGESFDGLTYSQNRLRKKILTVLAEDYGFSVSAIAVHLGITRKAVRRYLAEFKAGGTTLLLGRKLIGRKADVPALKTALFALLHEPPSLSGFNRTTWRLEDLHKELARRGHPACGHVISAVIKEAGYRWRCARVVLTSNDPDYREKLNQIRNILSHLKGDERFFSIDEFGPFAIKVKGGRTLVEPGVQPIVPQWQKSKGSLIVTAALELSGNRVTHFYSKAKNTTEMIKMAKQLIEEYKDARTLYLSWDAASWHMSKELLAFVNDHNNSHSDSRPELELTPLPASAQFLNVIESVFSGMARAIIHNSDYPSVKAATDAIDRYFAERNQHYKETPKRAGNKIWGLERTGIEFSESNNCKDPAYR